jgi:hypothetical protein
VTDDATSVFLFYRELRQLNLAYASTSKKKTVNLVAVQDAARVFFMHLSEII